MHAQAWGAFIPWQLMEIHMDNQALEALIRALAQLIKPHLETELRALIIAEIEAGIQTHLARTLRAAIHHELEEFDFSHAVSDCLADQLEDQVHDCIGNMTFTVSVN